MELRAERHELSGKHIFNVLLETNFKIPKYGLTVILGGEAGIHQVLIHDAPFLQTSEIK